MIQQLINKVISFIDGKNFKLNREFITFLVCVLISFSFWLLRVLNGTMSTTIKIPISAINIPKGTILSNSTSKYIKIEVEDQGFSIINYNLFKSIGTLSFELNPIDSSSGDLITQTFYLKDRERAIKEKLLASSKITTISPELISFQLSRIGTKKVPITYSGQISSSKQYIAGKANLDPDSVVISGSQIFLDSITTVNTENLDLTNLTESVHKTISLVGIKDIKYSTEKTNVDISVSPFTEESLQIPIVGVNFPDSVVFRPMPGSVKVVFNIPLSTNITENDFSIKVDYNDSTILKSQTLILQLHEKPTEAFNVRIDPSQIDFLIEQK